MKPRNPPRNAHRVPSASSRRDDGASKHSSSSSNISHSGASRTHVEARANITDVQQKESLQRKLSLLSGVVSVSIAKEVPHQFRVNVINLLDVISPVLAFQARSSSSSSGGVAYANCFVCVQGSRLAVHLHPLEKKPLNSTSSNNNNNNNSSNTEDINNTNSIYQVPSEQELQDTCALLQAECEHIAQTEADQQEKQQQQQHFILHSHHRYHHSHHSSSKASPTTADGSVVVHFHDPKQTLARHNKQQDCVPRQLYLSKEALSIVKACGASVSIAKKNTRGCVLFPFISLDDLKKLTSAHMSSERMLSEVGIDGVCAAIAESSSSDRTSKQQQQQQQQQSQSKGTRGNFLFDCERRVGRCMCRCCTPEPVDVMQLPYDAVADRFADKMKRGELLILL